MKTRTETDSLGEVEVPEEAYWGAQTQRAVANGIAVGRVPRPVVDALVLLKQGAARVNAELGLIPEEVGRAIGEAAVEVLHGRLGDPFPLSPFQTGSGTSTNMNVNEVLAHRAAQLLETQSSARVAVHPNDHVNRCQSSNDAFPTAIHLAASLRVRDALAPAAARLVEVLSERAHGFSGVLKLGRTHLMDALPVTLGQEFGGYARQVALGLARVERACEGLWELPLGGTAVGTGANAHPDFAERVIRWLADRTGVPFARAADPFEAQGSRDACVAVSGSVRGVAIALSKISNDLRWMASGPYGGLAEIRLPALQPGSSIMPGKVNPVVPEAVIQAAAQVVGNDVVVAQGGAGGVLELNLMMPVIARNLLESIDLVAGACGLLADRCVSGIEADPERCRQWVERSLSLATPLAELIGYDATARVVKEAARRRAPLLDVALEMEVAPEAELRRLLDPAGMVGDQGRGTGNGEREDRVKGEG